MCLLGMATLLKRLLTVCLALAFLVGVTGQLMPSSMAEPQTTVSAEMDGGCAGPHPPCTEHLPTCLDHGGCISVSVLPTSPTTIAVPVVDIARLRPRPAGTLWYLRKTRTFATDPRGLRLLSG